MDTNKEAYSQIGLAMAKHFDSVYYVDIESGHYTEFVPMQILKEAGIPRQGEDFFRETQENASKCVHPSDLKLVMSIHDRENMKKHLSDSYFYSVVYRLLVNGMTTHVRHVEILCEDKKHVICCLENIEGEVRLRKQHELELQSARRMARLDELTGVRNKNAFMEYIATLDDKIRTEGKNFSFGIVMCDINDLKLMNDTRGHSFGDEAIQRTGRMICGTFRKSPVFRIGGDEFVVIAEGEETDQLQELTERLKEESAANKRTRSGPVVAIGMAVFDPDTDHNVDDVYKRADGAMYEHKKVLKAARSRGCFVETDRHKTPITDERKRLLDELFGALTTISGGGYVYLNDLRYDFSRWSLPLVDDFGIESEYMYRADKVWAEHIHPDDMEVYKGAVEEILNGNGEIRPIRYRARRSDGSYVTLATRGFVLSDSNGDPEYFGGIMIPQ